MKKVFGEDRMKDSKIIQYNQGWFQFIEQDENQESVIFSKLSLSDFSNFRSSSSSGWSLQVQHFQT